MKKRITVEVQISANELLRLVGLDPKKYRIEQIDPSSEIISVMAVEKKKWVL